MLRNLGEVLVACYFPVEYAAVLRDMVDTRSPERVSTRRILQFEYEELASEVIREWHMPWVSDVLSASVRNERQDPAETVVSFAHGLTSAVYRHGSAPSHQAVTLLLLKYAVLGLSREDVVAILEAGIKGTRETFAQARVRLDDLQLKHQMAAALMEPQPSSIAMEDVGSPDAAPPDHESHSNSLVHQALENEKLDTNQKILIILEATLTAGGFDRAMVALASGAKREVCGRLALGVKSDELIEHFRYPMGLNGGPVGVALSRGRELMVVASWELLPDEQRLLRSLEAGALVVLPLLVDGRVLGAFYVDTVSPRQPSEAALASARHMRDAVLIAMRLKTASALTSHAV